MENIISIITQTLENALVFYVSFFCIIKLSVDFPFTSSHLFNSVTILTLHSGSRYQFLAFLFLASCWSRFFLFLKAKICRWRYFCPIATFCCCRICLFMISWKYCLDWFPLTFNPITYRICRYGMFTLIWIACKTFDHSLRVDSSLQRILWELALMGFKRPTSTQEEARNESHSISTMWLIHNGWNFHVGFVIQDHVDLRPSVAK